MDAELYERTLVRRPRFLLTFSSWLKGEVPFPFWRPMIVSFMTEETTSLVLEHLRHIRAKLDVIDDRLARVELRLTAVEGHLANLLLAEASQNSEIDKIKQRLDRIERRLELVD